MSELAKGLWALLLLITLVLGGLFLIPLLIHLMLQVVQMGWEAVG